MAEISIIYDRVRWEEKALSDRAASMGHNVKMIDAKDIAISTHEREDNFGNVIIQRCVSHYRGLYITACLEYLNKSVINTYAVSELCGNKLLTSLCLAKSNVPTPRTYFAFSPEVAVETASKMGYPVVLKPLVGSWGRMVISVRDKDIMESIIEMREEMPNPLSRVYYIQDYIERPPRDIRTIVIGEKVVTAIYRYSAEGEWRTNIARGGRAEECKITNELEDICLKAAKAVGGGVLGVDLMEDKNDGLLVHEINNTVEFKGASSVSSKDIAGEIIEYAARIARR